MAWWDGSEILGGRDAVAGGTWLACSRTGRVALLTNVLELHPFHEAKSRGELPVLFLEVTLFILKPFLGTSNLSLLVLDHYTTLSFPGNRSKNLVMNSPVSRFHC